MKSGREISREFIEQCLWPAVTRDLPGAADRLAVAIIGIGSDVTGLDDKISRDHHWGPRANILVLPEDAADLLPRITTVLETGIPKEWDGFKVSVDNTLLTGACCCSIDHFFRYFLGTADLPQSELEWVHYCEVDLNHVTSGEVVIDRAGEMTRRREVLAYYPDSVWKKRIADWCMYITGRDAPYNVNRVTRREDFLTARIYRAAYCKEVMELCFALNRRYAPYTKWLNRTYRDLPLFADRIAPWMDEIMEAPDLQDTARQMVDLNYILGECIAELGLAGPPERRPFDDSLTVLSLYDSAAEIYSTLPRSFVDLSFNRTEMWERLVREALFAPEECHNVGRSGPPAKTRAGGK